MKKLKRDATEEILGEYRQRQIKEPLNPIWNSQPFMYKKRVLLMKKSHQLGSDLLKTIKKSTRSLSLMSSMLLVSME
jgi:hypothetical protein